MNWHLVEVRTMGESAAPENWEGRFVLQAHRDNAGAHLDLRLEYAGVLLGFRVAATELEAGSWATEKSPHPLRWLDQDGTAERLDEGKYAWVQHDAESGILHLNGRDGQRVLHFKRETMLAPAVSMRVHAWLAEHDLAVDSLPALVEDGYQARKHAVRQLLGLGRVLEQSEFDVTYWEEHLRHADLKTILAHLQRFEARFDTAFAPNTCAQPAPISEQNDDTQTAQAWAMLLGNNSE